MELYGLDCVDLVVSYTIQYIFIAKKCKFSQKEITNIPPSPAASNRYGLTDCYAKKEKKDLCEEKGGYLKSKHH